MIGGVCKAYNLTFDYVLYKMSYANLVMYCSILESYDDEKPTEKGNENKTTGLSFHELLGNLKKYE
jgi:hypothetical protein